MKVSSSETKKRSISSQLMKQPKRVPSSIEKNPHVNLNYTAQSKKRSISINQINGSLQEIVIIQTPSKFLKSKSLELSSQSECEVEIRKTRRVTIHIQGGDRAIINSPTRDNHKINRILIEKKEQLQQQQQIHNLSACSKKKNTISTHKEQVKQGKLNNKNIEMEKKKTSMLKQVEPKQEIRIENIREKILSLLKERPEFKLNLVLDLDETLVNSAWASNENKQGIKQYIESLNKNIINQTQSTQKNLTGFVSIMRPRLKDFLSEIRDLFTVYVYSHGRKEYVLKVLEKINPRKHVLDSSRTFKNDGQVTPHTLKNIRNIIPSVTNRNISQVLKQTIIVDDFMDIWLEETRHNVVPIKRFQPLIGITKKVFPLVVGYNGKQPIQFGSSVLDLYQDIDYYDHSNASLSYLEHYICSVGLNYYSKIIYQNCAGLPDIRDELAAEQLKIFTNKHFCLQLLADLDIFSVCQFIITASGGHISTDFKANPHVLILPQTFNSLRKRVIAIQEEYPKMQLINIKWITDSFFSHQSLEIKPYIL